MTLRTLSLAAALCAAPVCALADQVRILAFGDSLTAGYGLKPNEGLVPQLQDWLRARGHDAEDITQSRAIATAPYSHIHLNTLG